MPDRAARLGIVLPDHLQAMVNTQIASGRYADALEVLTASLAGLEQNAPADGSATSSGPVHALAELNEVYRDLQAVRAERDFIIQLTARQRLVPHPEAVMQLTAEQLGAWLKADRTGFYRIVGEEVEFGAGWGSGRVRVLRGRMPLSSFGEGTLAMMRWGQPVITENSYADPARDAATYARLNAVAALSLPLMRDMMWVGGLYVQHAEARHWTEIELSLAKEVAELTWDAVERADALRQLTADVARGEVALGQAASDLRDETTTRITAEGLVRQLQKMEAVGQLTGGIAHDFNNMLAVIIGSLNLMQRRLAKGDTNVEKFVDNALDGATRAAALTHRLLAFSRQQPLAPEALDANRMIGGMTELLNRTLGEAVQVETVLGAGVWPSWVDPSQLENALLNLAVNARDAMPEGGKLTIETTNVYADTAYARENGVAEGQYVVLAVTDTGTGMTPEVMSRVFEPFYTTKGAGKGTGLGLSQVFGFVKQSDGNIKLYSELGVGTAVKLYLPRYYGASQPTGERRAAEAAEPIRGGDPREIVLVVEDEERVRLFSVGALRELGYTVIHASSGEEALTMIQGGQDVSLLFTDIVMPGMNGRQLADQAKTLRPAMPVLYTTGFTRNAVVHNGTLDAGTNFLPKPFGLDQLAGMVRQVLDQEG